jgi:hypothetical protein
MNRSAFRVSADGHDGVLNSGDSAEDSLDCDSEMGVDEWSGMGNYNKEKQLLFKFCTKWIYECYIMNTIIKLKIYLTYKGLGKDVGRSVGRFPYWFWSLFIFFSTLHRVYFYDNLTMMYL